MTLYRTRPGTTNAIRTGLTAPLKGRRTYLGDFGLDAGQQSNPIGLKWALTPLASNAVAVVVTNTNISVYSRNTDGSLGALQAGTTSTWGTNASDAGRLPTESATNFVGISGAPAAAKKSWLQFGSTQDVEWILPGHPLNPQKTPLDRPFGLYIQGGRNHRMLYAVIGFSKNWLAVTNGGTGQNTPVGSGYFAQWNRCFYIMDYTGIFDIAYMDVRPGNLYEVFNVTNGQAPATPQRFRMQRSRIGRVIWYNPGSGHDGGDPLQIWHGPKGYIEIDRVTIETDYQGLFLAWNDVGTDMPPAGFTFSNINIRTIVASGAWIYYNTKGGVGADAYGTGINVPPTSLSNVYVADVSNPTRVMSGNNALVYTNGGITPATGAAGDYADWSAIPAANTTGRIQRVAPDFVLPSGDVDYAPANKVGFSADATWTGWNDQQTVVTAPTGYQSGYPATY